MSEQAVSVMLGAELSQDGNVIRLTFYMGPIGWSVAFPAVVADQIIGKIREAKEKAPRVIPATSMPRAPKA